MILSGNNCDPCISLWFPGVGHDDFIVECVQKNTIGCFLVEEHMTFSDITLLKNVRSSRSYDFSGK